jgi:hypothetical protein
MNFLKYFKLLGLFKDAITAYREESGKDSIPVILHRRVFGAIIILLGIAAGVYFGIDSDILSGNLQVIIESIDKIVSATLVLYGTIQVIVGVIGARKRNVT